MRITLLIENTSSDKNIYAEHGLSLYIETTNHIILFDMGQTDLFTQNAETLGVDLRKVDIAVLSHGHYDHGGGMKKFLNINNKAQIYVNRYAFEPYYNSSEKYIGLDTSLEDNSRLIFTDDIYEIEPGITLYSCNKLSKKFELGSFGLKMLNHDLSGNPNYSQFLPDDFRHEQYLMLNENGMKILISGCSHKGILNIAEWFEPNILIGGFHFSKLPLDCTLKSYAKYLSQFNTDFYTCHCTGTEQFAFMKNHMNRLFYISAGQSITI